MLFVVKFQDTKVLADRWLSEWTVGSAYKNNNNSYGQHNNSP
jgi:hypothetical protein